MALLETRNLTVMMGATTLCKQLDLSVAAGQRWAILGRNGVGKTTLLHTLAGLRPAYAGEVLLHGRPLSMWSRRAIAQSMGVLFQESAFVFPSTVLETALTGRHPFVSPWRGESAEDLRLARQALQETDLLKQQNRLVQTLSGGEKRRLELAVLLAQSPRMLLMDEPTNHLDLHHQVTTLDHLQKTIAKTQGAWITVFHDINLAARYCDFFLFLFGNGETCQGAQAKMLQEPLLYRLFQHPLLPVVDPAGRRFWIPQ